MITAIRKLAVEVESWKGLGDKNVKDSFEGGWYDVRDVRVAYK
jgi:hypothetical protein